MTEEIKNRLLQYYRVRETNPVIDNLTDITSGWESQLFAFSLETGEPSKRIIKKLVLRLFSGEGARDKAAHEFKAMRRLYDVGYPVPCVHQMGDDLSPFSRPFVVMDWIEGNPLWGLMRSQKDSENRELISSFSKLFVQLHRLDWRLFNGENFSSEENSPYQFVDEWLGIAENAVGHYQLLGFIPVLNWLRSRREQMACERPSPVHHDFHPGNVLMERNGSLVVIDWTNFRISDPRFDLAWTLVLANSYLGPKGRAAFLVEYEQASGGEVISLACFEVFACLRRLFDMLVSTQFGAEEMGMLASAVEEMRKDKPAYQRVYEMLRERTSIRVPEIESMLSSLNNLLAT